jgi:hypothetical protein
MPQPTITDPQHLAFPSLSSSLPLKPPRDHSVRAVQPILAMHSRSTFPRLRPKLSSHHLLFFLVSYVTHLDHEATWPEPVYVWDPVQKDYQSACRVSETIQEW